MFQVIFVQRPDGPTMETGKLMGQLTDEILQGYGPNMTIKSFASSGAKSYVIELIDRVTGEPVDIIQKCKGFRLIQCSIQHLNQYTLLDSVFLAKQQTVPFEQIVKYSKTGEIYSRSLEKVFRCTYNKRLRLKDHKTLPLGTVALPGEESSLYDSDDSLLATLEGLYREAN